MGGDIAVIAGQLVDGLTQVWPVVGGAAGAAGAKLLERLGNTAADAASEEAVGWARRVLTRLFARRQDGTPVDPDEPLPEDATVDAEVDAEVIETLDELAANPDSKAARRLLIRRIQDAATADPALVEVLRELAAQAPSISGSVGRSGGIAQHNRYGANIGHTGSGDINIGNSI